MVLNANKLNNLSIEEYVALKSTLFAIDNKQFICSQCLNQYNGRSNEDAMLKKIQEAKGCYEAGTIIKFKIDEISFYKCIGNYFKESSIYIIELFKWFEKGIMPFPGSLSDQPYKIIEAFRIIEAYNVEQMIQRMKKEQQRGRKSSTHSRRRY